jgi:acylphosphatase
MIRLHVLVSGRVQGVGYRYGLRQAAVAAGVTGWVRNRADGRVEAELEGPTDAVEQVHAWLARGPAGAAVDDVQTHAVEPAGSGTFEIRATF